MQQNPDPTYPAPLVLYLDTELLYYVAPLVGFDFIPVIRAERGVDNSAALNKKPDEHDSWTPILNERLIDNLIWIQ